jgi:hypothetical protein
VVSLYFLALGTLYPLGATVQGPIADRIGLGQMTVIGALAMLGVVALLRVLRPDRLRALDDVDVYPSPLTPPDPPDPPEAGTGAGAGDGIDPDLTPATGGPRGHGSGS